MNVLLVPAHPGFPGQIPQSRKTVVVVVVANRLHVAKNNLKAITAVHSKQPLIHLTYISTA